MFTFKLSKAINCSGCDISELNLDFEALSTADFRAAQKVRALISDSQSVDASKMFSVLRLDAEFQIAVGWIAACKGTEGVNQPDFLKLSLLDSLKLGEETSNYFFTD